MGKTTDRPRIAVIGAGAMANDFHLPSQRYLAKTGRSTLEAVCDINEKAAAAAAKKFGIPRAYHDVDTMLNEIKPDGVVVITPLPVTAPLSSKLLRKGIPVLMEKPPGDSVKACRQIIAAYKASRTNHQVAFNRRYCPVLVQGKAEALKRGAIKGGSAQMYRKDRRDDEFFFGTGIHALDGLRFLAGDMDEIDTDFRPLAKGECPAFTLRISYKNGTVGTLVIRPQAGVQLERYEVFAPLTTVLIRAGVGWLVDTPGACTVYQNNEEVKVADPLAPYKNFKGDLRVAAVGGFYGENEAFVAALRGKGKFSPTVEESLQSVEIAEAVQKGKSWKRRT